MPYGQLHPGHRVLEATPGSKANAQWCEANGKMCSFQQGMTQCSASFSTWGCGAYIRPETPTPIISSCLAPAHATDSIPPRLVQVWDTNTPPPDLKPMVEKWRSVDGWSTNISSDADGKSLIEQKYNWLLPTFLRYKKQVQRADIARLAWLHDKGGVYADLDAEPCSTRSEHLRKVLGPQRLTLVLAPSKQHLTNFFIASIAGHPFLDFALRQAPGALERAEKNWANIVGPSSAPQRSAKPDQLTYNEVSYVTMEATGPHFFDRAWKKFLNSSGKCRDTWRATTRVFTYEEWTQQVGIHEWASTWHGTKEGPSLRKFREGVKAEPSLVADKLVGVCSKVGAPVKRNTSVQVHQPCVAFMHVVKSGGQTIKASLAAAGAHQLLPRQPGSEPAHVCSCEGRYGRCAAKISAEGRACDIVMGTNVLQLRPNLPQCKWLTMVRHPIAALISSLHYCRNPSQQAHGVGHTLDQLCGNSLDARRASPRAWAAYRRDPLFWTLALDPRFSKRLGLSSLPAVAPNGVWSEQRAALRNRDNATRAVASEMAAAIVNGSLFDAIGLVEEWEQSMRAFDAVVPLTRSAPSSGISKLRWANWSAAHADKHGSASWAAQEKRDLEESLRDPEITRLLSTDLKLYAAFVTAFQKQR